MENAAQENWQTVLSLFPALWRERAGETGAVERLRGFSSAEALLRTLLLHIANGFSLRETAVQAKLAHLANVSDVALLKRLRNSEEWLRQLCLDLLQENGIALATHARTRRLRIVDGTIVKEPGKTGSQWRILYSLRLPDLSCDFFAISATEGEGTGESFRRLPIGPQELVLGDAGYWSAAGIEFVRNRKADVLVRVNPQSFVAYERQGRRVGLLRRLQTIRQPGQIGEWKVVLRGENTSVEGRVCAIRKSEHAIQQAHRRLQRKASKKQTILKPETLEYAKYVIVFTTLAAESAGDVLECYRLRWQIELACKRLKTLAQLGHLPKHDDRSARAWLYGKLLVALLTQKLIQVGRDISPWGYSLPVASSVQPLA
jgi:Transposase DDE domain